MDGQEAYAAAVYSAANLGEARPVHDTDFLAQVPLFQSLPAEQLAELARLCEPRRFRAGEAIFHVDDPSDEMYVVQTGGVRIYMRLGSKDVELARLGPGEFFGELALLDGERRSAHAQSVEETSVLVLRRDRFFQLLAERPAVAIAMLGVLSRRIRGADALMRGLASKNVNVELAERLTFADRLADAVASFGGSWSFVIAFVAVVTLWMLLNTFVLPRPGFDGYPYQFLNLVLAVVAAMQAPFIMMSQNRQATKDRIRSDLDYQVNLKNELALTDVKEQIEELRRVELPLFAEDQRARLADFARRIEELERRVGAGEGGAGGADQGRPSPAPASSAN